jgi:hypothetical protein
MNFQSSCCSLSISLEYIHYFHPIFLPVSNSWKLIYLRMSFLMSLQTYSSCSSDCSYLFMSLYFCYRYLHSVFFKSVDSSYLWFHHVNHFVFHYCIHLLEVFISLSHFYYCSILAFAFPNFQMFKIHCSWIPLQMIGFFWFHPFFDFILFVLNDCSMSFMSITS